MQRYMITNDAHDSCGKSSQSLKQLVKQVTHFKYSLKTTNKQKPENLTPALLLRQTVIDKW